MTYSVNTDSSTWNGKHEVNSYNTKGKWHQSQKTKGKASERYQNTKTILMADTPQLQWRKQSNIYLKPKAEAKQNFSGQCNTNKELLKVNKAGFQTAGVKSCIWKEGNLTGIGVALLEAHKAITNRQEGDDLLNHLSARPRSLWY